MAYDEDLAHRVRELLFEHDGLSEMTMFGGLAFLLDGHMAVAVSSRGGLMVRVGADAFEEAIAKPHVQPMEMGGGRRMTGWVRVDAAGVKTKRQLAAWVRSGATLALTLPPKR